MYLLWFEHTGLYLYASTEEIMENALTCMPMLKDTPYLVDINCGDIVKIDANGEISRSKFDSEPFFDVLYSWRGPKRSWNDGLREYIEDLKCVASAEGFHIELIETMLQQGYTLWEIESFIYDGAVC